MAFSRLGLAALSLLLAGSARATRYDLQWGAPAGTVSGYRIYYATVSFNRGGSFLTPAQAQGDSAVHIENLAAPQTAYCMFNLPLAQSATYYFRLTAYNGSGESPFNVDSNGNNAETQVFTDPALFVDFSTATNFVRLVLDPADATKAVLSLIANDTSFVLTPTMNAQLGLPSGSKNLVLTELAAGSTVYYVRTASATFGPQDYSGLEGASVPVTVSGVTYPATGQGWTFEPALGGLIQETSGAQAIVGPAGIGLDARVQIASEPADPGGTRAAALARQGLTASGPGKDFKLSSCGSVGSAITANVNMPFDPQTPGFDASRLRLASYNASADRWDVLDSSTIGAAVQAAVTHFSIYRPVLLPAASSIPGLRDMYVYPNPASGSQDPVIRAFVGSVDRVEITIFDLSGNMVHSATVEGPPTGISQGLYYYDYKWTAGKASGVYFAVIHAKTSDGTVLRARTKFAVVR